MGEILQLWNSAQLVAAMVDFLLKMAVRLLIALVTAYLVVNLVFVRDATRRVNACCGERVYNPVAQMWLCMLVPFYAVYWAWHQADRLDEAVRARGLPLSALGIPCLLLSAVCPYLAILALENRANALDRSAQDEQAQVAQA